MRHLRPHRGELVAQPFDLLLELLHSGIGTADSSGLCILELEDAKAGGVGGPDPRVKELQQEIERLRYQLASVRAEVTHLREERDQLKAGIERALDLLAEE